MAGPILTRADANKDGKLTPEELLAAAGAVFDEFDKAKTGKLDEEAFGDLLTSVFQPPNIDGPPPKGPAKDGKVRAPSGTMETSTSFCLWSGKKTWMSASHE